MQFTKDSDLIYIYNGKNQLDGILVFKNSTWEPDTLFPRRRPEFWNKAVEKANQEYPNG